MGVIKAEFNSKIIGNQTIYLGNQLDTDEIPKEIGAMGEKQLNIIFRLCLNGFRTGRYIRKFLGWLRSGQHPLFKVVEDNNNKEQP